MSQPEPNFTVDKNGSPWLEGVGRCSPRDLPPLLYIRWATVNDLQFEAVDCTVWLTFETIHVRNRRTGDHNEAPWHDVELLRSYLH